MYFSKYCTFNNKKHLKVIHRYEYFPPFTLIICIVGRYFYYNFERVNRIM